MSEAHSSFGLSGAWVPGEAENVGLKDSEEEARAGEVSGYSLTGVARTAAKAFPPRSHQDPKVLLHLDYIHSQALSLHSPESTHSSDPAGKPCCPLLPQVLGFLLVDLKPRWLPGWALWLLLLSTLGLQGPWLPKIGL